MTAPAEITAETAADGQAFERGPKYQAARSAATHRIEWDTQGRKTPEGHLVDEGLAVYDLDTGIRTDFIITSAWSTPAEVAETLTSAGYQALGFSLVRKTP